MNLQKILGTDQRTRKANTNVIFSMGIKGLDAITQFLLVPVTLGFLNPYEYGIWLTLNSILVWINSFDIGLGNGLRNQLAIAVANDDKQLARSLVSTAFGMITILMLCIFAIGSLLLTQFDWYSILNADQAVVPNLNKVVYVSFALFCVNFMVKFVGNVYLAMQMPSINNLLVSLGHILSLVLIWILTKTTDGSLYKVAFAFSISPVIIYILAYPVTFYKVYKYLRPTPVLFNTGYLKTLFNVGVLFFILQISGVILFALSNVIISKLYGPDSVTPFNIVQRYFSVINMLLSVTLAPMWSAVTDAYAKGEIDWIRNSLKKTDILLTGLAIIIVFMFIASPWVYKIWVGDSVHIPLTMTFLMGLYTLIIVSSTGYAFFLNGIGKLKIQTITTLSVAIIFIPVIYTIGKYTGINGIIIGMCVLNSFGAILNRVQVNLIINGKAKGIWNK